MSLEESLLREALELDAGADVTLISREPLGAGSATGFEVRGSAESADASEGEPLTYFVDTSRRVVARETGMLVGTPQEPEARVWLHPADPHLPALAPVAFANAAETLLTRLGFADVGAPALVVYRPGRRAVLRVPAEGGIVWVKVVPPARAQRIVDTHAALAAGGVPVPAVRGWSPEGLLVLENAAGTPAQDVGWEPEALLDEVDRLRERFAAVALPFSARTELLRRLAWYSERLRPILPEVESEIAARLERDARAAWADDADATIHGDLHFGQLFLDDDGRIRTIIDVDTSGTGPFADDAAAFLSHAVASAIITVPPQDERVWALARGAMRRWAAPGLRSRTVAHLLGHALGAAERGAASQVTRLLGAATHVMSGDVEALR